MKLWRNILVMTAAMLSLASCSSNDNDQEKPFSCASGSANLGSSLLQEAKESMTAVITRMFLQSFIVSIYVLLFPSSY